jgi:phosphoadenylyl-sulfate reductase (thioredoxin)
MSALTQPEIAAAGQALETAAPELILAWAASQLPRVSFATGFGAEGCVLIDLVARHSLPIELFTLDTGVLFPETYDLWRRLEDRYGVTIRAVRPALTLDEQAVAHGPRLWERDPDACCAIRKVAPLAETLRSFDAWITAIRRDQTATRASAQPVEWDSRNGLIKVNPLVRWTSEDVWTHIRQHDVPYNPLYDRGYGSIGCAPCTTPVAPGEDPRAGRWRAREKNECGLHIRLQPVSS